MFGKSGEDRRSEIRRPADRRAVVLASGLELPCRITDESRGGLKLKLDRRGELPRQILVIEVTAALVVEVDVRWTKGHEAGGRRGEETNLRGLVPQRLAAAREAWVRAGGR